MRANVWLVLAFIEAVAFAPAGWAREVITGAKQSRAPGTVIEAESLAEKAKVSGGPVTVQNMQPFGVQWGGGAQLFWRPPAPVDEPLRNWPHLTTSLSAPAAGEYSIVLYYTVAPDFGTFRVFLNGEPVKDVNGFAPAVGLRKLELAKTPLKAGSQQLVFTVFSKEPAATNYFVGLDRFEVTQVQLATGPSAAAQLPGPVGRGSMGTSETAQRSRQDAAGTCGDPVVAAAYATCSAAKDRPSCEAAGGTWTKTGLQIVQPEECQCPTGQGACVCKSSNDCVSSCVAETGPGGIFDCDGVTSGMCSPVAITVGCWCWFDENGTVSALCVE